MIRPALCCLLLILAGNASATMAERAQRISAGGVDLVTYRTDIKDVINIVGALPAGDAFAGSGNAAVPTLTGMMLDRGTTALDKFAIAQQLESVGAQITFAVGAQSMEFHARCLKKDLPLVIRLIAADLRSPALAQAEFAKAKLQLVGTLEQSMQNTEMRAQQAFQRAIYPAGHPNRPHSIEEYLAAAKSASLEDVRKFHAKMYGPAHLTLVVAGDVDVSQAEHEVSAAFSGWSGGVDYLRPATAASATGPSELTVPLADKPSVNMVLGQPTGLKYRDPDSLPLRLGTAVLGRGFTSRLMSSVRNREGLTYAISAGMGEDSLADGSWQMSASFAPALLAKGLTSSRRELNQWWDAGVTEAELDDRKQGVIGSYFVSLSTTGSIAAYILTTLQRGYDLDWLDRYPQAVKALTAAQVNAVIKSRLNPSNMVLVEAGSVPAGAPSAPVSPH